MTMLKALAAMLQKLNHNPTTSQVMMDITKRQRRSK